MRLLDLIIERVTERVYFTLRKIERIWTLGIGVAEKLRVGKFVTERKTQGRGFE